MELDSTICKASEVVGLVKADESDDTPYALVISIEHPCDKTVSLEQGRAPRLVIEVVRTGRTAKSSSPATISRDHSPDFRRREWLDS